MGRYILKRILFMIPVLFCVTILIFTLMFFVPGDPASTIAGGMATQEDLEQIREQLGFNEPYLVRLGAFLETLFLHGSFGNSYIYGTDVMGELIYRFPKTLIIAGLSILLCVLIGVPLGIRAAVRANTWEDRLSMFVSMIGVSMPNFWLALLLVLLFSLQLKLLPSSGSDTWKNFVLPVCAGALGGVAGMARLSRSSMLEVIRADYVTTARAKGVSEHNVIYHHALPNALIPIVTSVGSSFGGMLGGTVVVETIFSIPGLGLYLINGINNRDYNVVQGSVIFIAFVFSVVMLLVDIAYAYVDPRIKAQYASQGVSRRKKSKGVS